MREKAPIIRLTHPELPRRKNPIIANPKFVGEERLRGRIREHFLKEAILFAEIESEALVRIREKVLCNIDSHLIQKMRETLPESNTNLN